MVAAYAPPTRAPVSYTPGVSHIRDSVITWQRGLTPAAALKRRVEKLLIGDWCVTPDDHPVNATILRTDKYRFEIRAHDRTHQVSHRSCIVKAVQAVLEHPSLQAGIENTGRAGGVRSKPRASLPPAPTPTVQLSLFDLLKS